MTHCTEKDLTLYYYRELSPEESQRLEQHLNQCADCKKEKERLFSDMASLVDPASPLSTSEKQAFTRQVLQRRPRKFWLNPAFGGALAAVTVLIAVFAWQPMAPVPHKGALPEARMVATEMAADALEGDAAFTLVADLEMAEQVKEVTEIELLQNLELLQNMELLQEFES